MVTGVLDKSSLIPRSELKSVAGQKRGFGDVGERSELEHNKRVKMKDLESVIRSEGKGNSLSEFYAFVLVVFF